MGWEIQGVSQKLSEELEKLTIIFNSENNFKVYRQLDSKAPSLPFLAVTLKDLTFLSDGNLDYYDDKPGLINFYKIRAISDAIFSLNLDNPDQTNYSHLQLDLNLLQLLLTVRLLSFLPLILSPCLSLPFLPLPSLFLIPSPSFPSFPFLPLPSPSSPLPYSLPFLPLPPLFLIPSLLISPFPFPPPPFSLLTSLSSPSLFFLLLSISASSLCLSLLSPPGVSTPSINQK